MAGRSWRRWRRRWRRTRRRRSCCRVSIFRLNLSPSPALGLPRSLQLAGHPGEPQQCPDRNKRRHGAGVLHRHGQYEAHVGVEALLVVRGEAETREAPTPGVALGLPHQRAAVAPPALRLRYNHRLHEEAAAMPYNPGEAGVANQLFRPCPPPQQHQADGEVHAGLLQGVDSRHLAPLPLRVDQVGAGQQQVGPQVDGHRPGRLRLSAVLPNILSVTIRRG